MTNRNIGARLRETRKRMGWTQQQAAAAAGVRCEQWSRYETGAVPLGAGAMAALAKEGADLRYVLTGEGRAIAEAATAVLGQADVPKVAAFAVENALSTTMRERLRQEIGRLGVTIAEAARGAGLPSAQGVHDVLAGRKRMSAELLAQMMGVGVDPMYVLSGKRSAPPLQPRAAALLDNYMSADEEGKRAIESTAAVLVAKG